MRRNKNTLSQVVTQPNGILSAGQPYRERGRGVLPLHPQHDSRPKPEPLEFPKRDGAAVGNAADRGRRLERPSDERYLVAEHTGLVLLGDRMAMGIDFRIA